ncbi:MAG: helicase, partial [Clostridiales bacterium]|nr:helicase [Clostridiales bacterium]
MGLFDKMKEPVFLKETSEAKEQLERLKEFQLQAPEKVKKQVEQEIKLLIYGILFDEQIDFELKNSYIPIYVLHDLYFE